MYILDFTYHARTRRRQRVIDRDDIDAAVNDCAQSYQGHTPNERVFIGREPPVPPVVVVTSWPPAGDGTLRVVTCFPNDRM